jgi:hypothetical protein
VKLHSIKTAFLEDASLSPAQLAARVRLVGRNGVADGLWIDARGMWVTSPEAFGVKLRRGRRISLVVHDPRLRWPDTFAEADTGGPLYLTTSRIQDMQWFEPHDPARLQTQLWALDPV